MERQELSSGHLVDTFFPQYMPFGDSAPGFADTCLLGELPHRPRPCLFIAFEQIDHFEQCRMGFSGILVVVVNDPISPCAHKMCTTIWLGAAPGQVLLDYLWLTSSEELQKLQLALYSGFQTGIGLIENPQPGVDLGDALQEQGVLGVLFQDSPGTYASQPAA
jgi:hypothetical protein